jgi:hypothetical protein
MMVKATGVGRWLLPLGLVAAIEEVALSKIYENTREYRSQLAQLLYRVPFSNFCITTTLNHRLLGFVAHHFVRRLRDFDK